MGYLSPVDDNYLTNYEVISSALPLSTVKQG